MARQLEIISYFCIVKRFDRFLRIIGFVVLILLTAPVCAQNNYQETSLPDSAKRQLDSVEISLLTCSPGQQIWSYYGHSAIRVYDPVHNLDIAVNYGLFDYNQKNFILRFVFGLCDYQMGIANFPMFLVEYAEEGRSVVQQRLNLTSEEKAVIMQAIDENYSPVNRVYRYNFFYDNCTTRARDILISHINGKVEYAPHPEVKTSWREMTHQWSGEHRWGQFGCDLLLGVKADGATDNAQQQFLPDTLRAAFASAQVVDPAGRRRALVDSTSTILKIEFANVPQESSIWDIVTPRMFFGLAFLVVFLISLFELRRKRTLWLVDVVLLTLDGLAGLVLFTMIFSQHPTVSLNFQILLLNPLSLFFVYGVVKKELSAQYHRYWNVLLVCIILFVIGGFFQDYAEGIYFLALSLLLRIGINRHIAQKATTKA